MHKIIISCLSTLMLAFLSNYKAAAQCDTTHCQTPTPSIDARTACILPNPAAFDCYHGATTPDAPVSFPPSWCTTIENNQWFAFRADQTTVNFNICASNCDSFGVQAALFSSNDCINFQFVSPCLGNIESNTCQILIANNLVVGQVYMLCIDGVAGALCDYRINCTSGTSETYSSGSRLKIYPNPLPVGSHTVWIETAETNSKPVTIVLTDPLGREYLRKNEGQFSRKMILETGKIPTGNYFVQIWQEGRMMARGLFLKE